MSRILYTDFEFCEVTEPSVKLVCCATYDPKSNTVMRFWLHNNMKAQQSLRDHFEKYDVIIGYSCVAEARSFLALGLDPLKWKWIDLFLEYRLITNHNDNMLTGKQLVDGKVIHARKPKPKWQRTDEDKATGFKPTHSLAEATYKLTGTIRDTVHKTKMRDLIISNPKSFTPDEQAAIVKYCVEDTVFLTGIFEGIMKEINELIDIDKQEYYKEAFWRGRYAVHTANMETRGYPFDVEKTKNFSRQVGTITYEMQVEINDLFPDILPFRWNKKEKRMSENQGNIKKWISQNHDLKNWMKTDGNGVSLSLDAWQKFYDFKHNYPKDNFGAQMVRYLKLKQSLHGFGPSGGKRKSFWDSVGSDGRARPYMNSYGAQSSRSQPGASGFMFLKPAWMRALVIPKPRHFIASIDYGQQEFFIAGLESGDKAMINAYLSGDPYLFGAKLAKAIPPEGTKETHKLVRDVYKNTYLGIQYGMSKFGLAFKLSGDTGRQWTEDEAQEQIDIFESTFPNYIGWKQKIIEDYHNEGCIELADGWKMWSDNDNDRSVANVPVQGFGAAVLRRAVDMAEAKGVKVLFTLHDAIYMEGRVGQEQEILKLRDAMIDGFVYYFKDKLKHYAHQIKLDPFVWGPDYKADSEITVGKDWLVPCSNLYVDERSKDDYDKFSKYFHTVDWDDL